MSYLIEKLMAWLLPAKPKKLGAFWGQQKPASTSSVMHVDPSGVWHIEKPHVPAFVAPCCHNPACARAARLRLIRSLYVGHPN